MDSTDPGFDSSDLHMFDQQFGLPDPPSFIKVSQTGKSAAADLPPIDPASYGSGAIASITLNGTSLSTTCTVQSGGSGYKVAPQVSFSGGGGSGAAAVAVLNNSGVVTSINVTNTGSGYTSAPTVTLANDDWEQEEALDVEWAHAIAPLANIILVECNSDSPDNLYDAGADWAATPVANGGGGATVVSMSIAAAGGSAGETSYDRDFSPSTYPGVTFLASTGDTGSVGGQGGYPADSPNVVAVGGTTLTEDPGLTTAGITAASNPTCTVLNESVSTCTVAPGTGGSGYSVPPLVSFSGGGGSGAEAVAVLNSSGVVTGINMISGGSGYTSAPTVTLTPGFIESAWNGSAGGLSQYEQLQNTFQESLTIHSGATVVTDNGARATPDVAFDADPNSGVEIYDSFNAEFSVSGASPVSGGTDYAVNDVLTVQGGVGTPAYLVVDSVTTSGGITSVSVDPETAYPGTTPLTGGLYTFVPPNAATVTGGQGSGATFNLTTQQDNLHEIGGTSLACPCWAGLIAITDQIRAGLGYTSVTGASQTLPALYDIYNNPTEYSRDFNDIQTGGNGTYNAGPGYDLVTGIGTPIANQLVPDLAQSFPTPAQPPTPTGFGSSALLPATLQSPPSAPSNTAELNGNTYTLTTLQGTDDSGNSAEFLYVSVNGGTPVPIREGDESSPGPAVAALDYGVLQFAQPSIAAFDNQLYIAWTGVDHDQHVNVATLELTGGAPTGFLLSSQTLAGDTSNDQPALGVLDNALFLAFVGMDANSSINLEFINPGGQFPNGKVVTPNSSSNAWLSLFAVNNQLYLGSFDLGSLNPLAPPLPPFFDLVNVTVPGVITNPPTLTLTGDNSPGESDFITVTTDMAGGVQFNQLFSGPGRTVTESFAPGTITTLDIQPLGENNTVLIDSLPAGVTVNIDSTGSDTIEIGDGTLADIQGTVSIQGDGKDILSVDDSADASPSTVTLNAGSLDFDGTLGLISWSGLQQLNVYAGGGANTINVLASDTATDLIGGNDSNTFNIGFDTADANDGSLANLLGTVTVSGGSGPDNRLLISDAMDSAGDIVTVTNGSVTFTSAALPAAARSSTTAEPLPSPVASPTALPCGGRTTPRPTTPSISRARWAVVRRQSRAAPATTRSSLAAAPSPGRSRHPVG